MMEAFFSFDTLGCWLFLLLLLVLGDCLAGFTRGRVPAILIAGLFFMLISWTGILPDSMAETAGIAPFSSLCTGLLIAGLGASMKIRTLLQQWKVVVLAVLVYLCQTAVILLLLTLLYDWNLALGAVPGGSMTALMIQSRAAELGHDKTIVLSVLFFSTQGFIAATLAGIFVRRESRRLLAAREGHEMAPLFAEKQEDGAAQGTRKDFFSFSPYGNLCKLLLIVWLSDRVGTTLGINSYILCLLMGMAAAGLRFVTPDTVDQSGAKTFLYYVLMASIMTGYGRATPALFRQMLIPLLLVLSIETLIVLLVSPALGQRLGFSRDMGICLGANIMMGFPLNMIIAEGIAADLTEKPEERAYLKASLALPMVIAGLSTTTTLAVLAGGILSGLMN